MGCADCSRKDLFPEATENHLYRHEWEDTTPPPGKRPQEVFSRMGTERRKPIDFGGQEEVEPER